jgi:hypothetical protein
LKSKAEAQGSHKILRGLESAVTAQAARIDEQKQALMEAVVETVKFLVLIDGLFGPENSSINVLLRRVTQAAPDLERLTEPDAPSTALH